MEDDDVNPDRKAPEAGKTLRPDRSRMAPRKAEACLFVKGNADLLTDADEVPQNARRDAADLFPRLSDNAAPSGEVADVPAAADTAVDVPDDDDMPSTELLNLDID
jgi:cobalamin biosynthesis protein CobT